MKSNKGKFLLGLLVGGVLAVGGITTAVVNSKKKADKLELERQENKELDKLENGEE